MEVTVSKDFICSHVSEEEGVLFHDIVNNIILKINRKFKYKKDNYFVIIYRKKRNNWHEITKILSDKDKYLVKDLYL